MQTRSPRLDRRCLLTLGAAAATTLLLAPVRAARASSSAIAPVVRDLSQPWSVAILPDGGLLVTERGGRLLAFDAEGGGRRVVAGTPEVVTGGQAGLFDVVAARDFARSRTVFLSFARAQGGGAGTALVSARLNQTADRLEDVRLLFEAAPGGRGGRHFGGRIVELPDGTLALTIGDRGADDRAQDLARHEGSVVRIARDGSVPPDNPFVGRADARPEIWSYGHRNPQGATLDDAGRLWLSEHGARGGDEVNRVLRGANYGWPVIAYGRQYSGAAIGVGTQAPGMEQPEHYWDPSIAPSGHVIHSGRGFAGWRGRHVVGSLNDDHIAVLDPATPGQGGWAQTRIRTAETARVRDIREGPDGSLWFLSVGNGALFRMSRPPA